MNCPECGYPRLAYAVSRKKFWNGRLGDSNRQEKGLEPRKDFETKPCPRCGWKGKIQPVLRRVPKIEVQEK